MNSKFSALVTLLCCHGVFSAEVMPFTYQGRLTRNGAAASGRFDFMFQCFTNSTSGNPVSEVFRKDAVDVKAGVFTVELQPTANVFTNTSTWIEVQVKLPSESNDEFKRLPRQAITASPYALSALYAPGIPNGMKEFLTSGTFTVPASVNRIMVDMWGGGSITCNPEWGYCDTGPGAYVRHFLAVTPGETLTVTIGSGGIDRAAEDSELRRGTDILLYAGGGRADYKPGQADPRALFRREIPIWFGDDGDGQLIPGFVNAPATNNGSRGASGYVLIQW